MIIDLFLLLAILGMLLQLAMIWRKDLPQRRQLRSHRRSVDARNARREAHVARGGEGDPPNLPAYIAAPKGSGMARDCAVLFLLILVVGYCVWHFPAWLGGGAK